MQRTVQRLLFWLIIIAAIWFVLARLTEIKMVARTLYEGRWAWISAAAIAQAGYYLLYARVYQCAFNIVDIHSRFGHMLAVMMAATFVNTVVPTGTAGSTLFVDDAARNGQSPLRATVGILLALMANYAALAFVVLIGLLDLFVRHDLKTYQIIATLILLLLILALSIAPILSLWKPHLLSGILRRVQRAVDRTMGWFGRRQALPADWADRLENQFSGAATAIRSDPRRLREILGVAVGAQAASIVSLFFVFLAFRQQIPLGPLVAGFAMGAVFYVVSITPGGIGAVEGVMALVYVSLGVPAARATVIAVAFRGLSFWLPLLVGFVVLRLSGSFRSRGQRPERSR